MKKLAIIGRGTAGCIAATHFLKFTDWHVDLYYDSNIKPQAVGEASWASFAEDLYHTIDFTYLDLENVDGNLKTGVSKDGWNKDGSKFFHHLYPGHVAYHFNAVKLQDFIIDKLKQNPRVAFFHKNITDYNNIDADFILDCSGRPADFNQYELLKHVPVNAVHVNMCYWDTPQFQYSLANATKYGWHFGIPLKNRCAVGYIYNKDFNTLDDVKIDAREVIHSLNLTQSDHTNSIEFKSYKRKENFTSRVVYSGNASFFLEPLEATSFWLGSLIQRHAYDIWHGLDSSEEVNLKYHVYMTEAETMIMLHYLSGSKFKTPFWEYAKNRGETCIREALLTNRFRNVIELSFNEDRYHMSGDLRSSGKDFYTYCGWGPSAFHQNIQGLGLKTIMKNLMASVGE